MPLPTWKRRLFQFGGWFGCRGIIIIGAIMVIVMMVASVAQSFVGNSTVKIDPDNIFVSDNAHLLSDDTKTEIHQLNEYYKLLPKRPQLMVITVDSVPVGDTIESFTLRMANQLGVGDASQDSGVVYLIAKNQRQARLEVGYGMEGQIPNSMTDLVTDETVKNDYRQNNYDAGVKLVTKRLDNLITTGSVGFVDTTAVSAGQTSGGFHPMRWVWMWLNTPQNIYILAVVIAIIAAATYGLYQLGARLRRQVRLDDLRRKYVRDLVAIDSSLDPMTLATHPERAAAAKATLRARINPRGRYSADFVATMPDYYSMDFAFGVIDAKTFLKTTRPSSETSILETKIPPIKKFENSSMYFQHKDWYTGGTESSLHSARNFFKHLRKEPDPNDVRPYLMSPLTHTCWFLLRWLTTLRVWIPAVIIGSIVIPEQLSPLQLLQLENFKDTILRVLSQAFTPLAAPLHILSAVAALMLIFYTIMMTVGMWGLAAQQRLRLHRMIYDYLNDLRAELPNAPSPSELAVRLMKPDSQLTMAKERLQKRLDSAAARADGQNVQKKWGRKEKPPLPDYYSMAFAFGWVTCEKFLDTFKTTSLYRTSSMYTNHRDNWYSEGSGDGGGGDSFGGGGFGGGGGTSSW
ncbi:MAG: TPM domain-containing protein [Bifidobacteriaceae bacterium]|jgi:uncharacterized membrane protein YgcG|nr:TPM domain-containing protein [Bifidobacteriaceae bacterium]MCI1978955.1 TPM domain-containing protein [Bifidobacteriaceae bacterium]